MKESNIAIICVGLAGLLVVGGAAGYVGYRMGQEKAEPVEEPVAAAEAVKVAPPVVVEDEPNPFPSVSDSDVEEPIAETEPQMPPGFDPEDMEAMEARRERWESMSLEQRRMMRKSFFSALANAEGIEELGDAIRDGKIDPTQFNIDPNEIADRMEIHAELMDEEGMQSEMSKTLQNIVNQAREQTDQP